jgi:hypothetical protein
LANDLKKINSSPNIFIVAHKTRNIYETSLNTYNELLHDNTTKTYKHGSEPRRRNIDNWGVGEGRYSYIRVQPN